MAYTLKDLSTLNPQYKKSWDPKTNTASLTNTANGKSISWTANNGAQYGIGSDENETGSHEITDFSKLVNALGGANGEKVVVGDQTATNNPVDLSSLSKLNLNPKTEVSTYTSPYSNQISAALNKYINPTAFSYNAESDPSYQAYKEQYTKAGNEAFQNIIGDLTSLTGGRLNTWATSAAAQAKNNYMEKLNDMVPTLEQNAYSRYQQGIDNIAKQLTELQGLDSTDYGRYRDVLSDKSKAEEQARQNYINTAGQYGNDYQAEINNVLNNNDTSDDWKADVLQNLRQQKIEKQKNTDTENFKNTISQYNNDYQAQINNVLNDSDPNNDWQAGYLGAARQKKIETEKQTAIAQQQQDLKNALSVWQLSGTATPEVAQVLGVPEGARTGDYDIAKINAAISQMNAETNQQNADTNKQNASTNAYEAETGRINAGTNAYQAETSRTNSTNTQSQNAIKLSNDKLATYQAQIDKMFSTPKYEDGKLVGTDYDVAKIKNFLKAANTSGTLSDPEVEQLLSRYGFSY